MTTETPPRPLLTRKWVCTCLEIDEGTLRRWERRGLIRVVRIGRTVRIQPAEFDRLLQGRMPR